MCESVEYPGIFSADKKCFPFLVGVGIIWLLQSKINREGVRYVDTTGGIRIVIAL